MGDHLGNSIIQSTETKTNDCLVCKGSGWLTPRVPVGHPDFGQVLPCRCQKSGQDTRQRIKILERYSNLGALRYSTFESANPNGLTTDIPSQQAFNAAYTAAEEYANAPNGWISFAGPSGSGKTFLAAAIANRRIEQSEPVLYITVADLLDYLRSGFDDRQELSLVDLYEQVRDAPMPVLDDLPTEIITTWSHERLLQLLSRRHQEQLPTVVTLRGEPSHLIAFLRTRLQSSDGIGTLYSLGRNLVPARMDLGTIPSSMRQRMTFATFDPHGNTRLTEHQQRNLATAKAYVQLWAQNPSGWLGLYGTYGVGKTHLAVAAGIERENLGDEVFFCTIPDLLDQLRASSDRDNWVRQFDLLERLKAVDMMILDEMKHRSGGPSADEKLFQIINYRYEERLPTIITSAFMVEEIAETRPEIASRLQDRLVVSELLIDAPDYRQGGARR